jgi:twinkle protein
VSDAKKIILATDNDAPGRALAVELARRLQPENCWLVVWPSKEDPAVPLAPPTATRAAATAASAGRALSVLPGHFKDANEVLMAKGPAFLRSCIEAAIPYPIEGILG